MTEKTTYALHELMDWIDGGGCIRRLAWEEDDMLWDCVWYIDLDGMIMAYHRNDSRDEQVWPRAKDICADDWVKHG